MVKTQDEPTVGHLGSAKNVQDPSTGRTRPPYRKHSTTLQFYLLQGLPKAGALQLVYIYIYIYIFLSLQMEALTSIFTKL